MPNPPAARAGTLLQILAAATLAAALLCDVAGLLLARPALWTSGGVIASPALPIGLLAAGLLGYAYLRGRAGSSESFRPRLRVPLLTAAGVGLYALARWVRGAADVPPDPVLLWGQGLGLVLLASGALSRRARPVTPTRES